jgi:hypothetical protein
MVICFLWLLTPALLLSILLRSCSVKEHTYKISPEASRRGGNSDTSSQGYKPLASQSLVVSAESSSGSCNFLQRLSLLTRTVLVKAARQDS